MCQSQKIVTGKWPEKQWTVWMSLTRRLPDTQWLLHQHICAKNKRNTSEYKTSTRCQTEYWSDNKMAIHSDYQASIVWLCCCNDGNDAVEMYIMLNLPWQQVSIKEILSLQTVTTANEHETRSINRKDQDTIKCENTEKWNKDPIIVCLN